VNIRAVRPRFSPREEARTGGFLAYGDIVAFHKKITKFFGLIFQKNLTFHPKNGIM